MVVLLLPRAQNLPSPPFLLEALRAWELATPLEEIRGEGGEMQGGPGLEGDQAHLTLLSLRHLRPTLESTNPCLGMEESS